MSLKNHLKDYSTFIGIVLVQVVLISAGLILISTNTGKEALITYTAPTDEITEGPSQAPQVTGTSTERGLVVSINVGTSEELELLPGIGEKTAQSIIDYREKNGVFKNLKDIMDVSGIGDQKFENIKPFISL